MYTPVDPANPYALPSNGANVNAAGAAKGLRASITYSPNPDIPTVHLRDGKYYMVSHRETCPGGLDMVQIDVDKSTNKIVALNTTNVDFSADPYDGIWYPCSGTVFPYGDLHLGSEEFEPDCRYNDATANADRSSDNLGAYFLSGVLGQVAQWSYYQNLFYTSNNNVNYSPGTNLASPPSAGVVQVTPGPTSSIPPTVVWPPGALEMYKCYSFGWTPTVDPDPKSAKLGGPNAKATKYYTLGRLSHEVSILLGDGRTMLLGDDRFNGILPMVVLDKKGDLSASTIYAAKLSNQVNGAANGQGTTWDVTWIKLGRGTQQKLKSMVNTIQFTDMFDTATVIGTGATASCPVGYTLISTVGSGTAPYQVPPPPGNTATYRFLECLKIKPGMQDVAAYFETRRVAGILGATMEWQKLEGVTYNPKLKKAYAALANFDNGALDGATTTPPWRWDQTTANDMRLPKNRCGGVFEFDLGLDWRPTKATVLLAGTPLNDPNNPGRCNLDQVAGPDNVHVIPGTSTLLIAEDVDPDKGHPNNFLWAYDVLRPQKGLVRIGIAEYDAEFTGQYTNFIGGQAAIFVAVQHPAAPPAVEPAMLGTNAPGYIGYLGLIPSSSMTGVAAAALQEGALDVATGKRVSAEHIVWQETVTLQELDFEPLPYTPPARDNVWNDIPTQTTSVICGTKVL